MNLNLTQFYYDTGRQRSEVVCVEKEAGRVDDKYCDLESKPDDKLRTCNEHLCPARYVWNWPITGYGRWEKSFNIEGKNVFCHWIQ